MLKREQMLTSEPTISNTTEYQVNLAIQQQKSTLLTWAGERDLGEEQFTESPALELGQDQVPGVQLS